MDILYNGKVVVKDEASTLVASIVRQFVKYTRDSKYTKLLVFGVSVANDRLKCIVK